MTSIHKVIVAGASANIGASIVTALQSAGFTVSILTRPDSTKTKAAYPDCNIVSTDYSEPSLLAAFAGQDAIVSCVGVDGIAAQIPMIDAAAQAGVKRFVPSEFGWSSERPILPELAARLEVKKKVLQHLVDKCRASSSMSWSVLVNGVLFDWALLKAKVLGFDIGARKAKIYDSGDEPFTGTTIADIGAATAELLLHADKTANRVLNIRSVRITQNSLLQALETVTAARFEVDRISTKTVIAGRKQKIVEKRFLEAFLDLLTVQLFEDGAGRGLIVPHDNDNELLGVREMPVADIVRRLLSTT